MAKTPFLLVENYFDHIWQFPTAVLSAVSEAIGNEARRVADGRRHRTWWSPTTDGGGSDTWIKVDLGAGVAKAPNSVWLDRGHNLHGKLITIEGSDDNATWPSSVTRTVPGSTVVGGAADHAANFSATEEGAHYNLFAAPTARRYWRVRIDEAGGFIPRVTGIILGTRAQLLGYSKIFDDDAGERKTRSEESDAGYVATGTIYHWRTMELDLTLIGDTEYDSVLRALRRTLFEQGGVAFAVMDYETKPERGWLFQYNDRRWDFVKKKVYRDGRIRLRESGHLTG